jgi:plastocyanin
VPKVLISAAVLAVSAAVAIPAMAASSTVTVGDNFFVKDGRAPTVTVKRGTTVRWAWRGHAPHNVTVTRGPVRFRSTTLTKGQYSRRLTKPGTYTIICTIHQPSMRMTLRVR